ERNWTFYLIDLEHPVFPPTIPNRPRPVYARFDIREAVIQNVADLVAMEAAPMKNIKRKNNALLQEDKQLQMVQKNDQDVGAKHALPDDNVNANAGMALEEVIVQVGDLRDAAMKKERVANPENEIRYYRAKEFPK